MKKFLFAILLLSFVKLEAYEITYSPWSLEYPEDLNPIFIQSEDRYLWVKESRTNEQYLPLTNIGDRIVDYDNYKYSKESTPSVIKPQEMEGRIIKEISETSSYPDASIKRLVLNEYDFYDDVSISEIDITDSFTGEKVEVLSDNKYSYLYDGDFENYNDVDSEIELTFSELQNIDELTIIIHYNSKSNKSSLAFNLFAEDNHRLHYKKYILDDDAIIVKKSELDSDYYLVITKWTYSDILYKTYELIREVTEDYYTEYDGYEKIESSKKTFYRYVTNDKVLLDGSGNLVTDPNYCIKSSCYVEYIEKEEEKPVEEKTVNPQTIDNIYYYFILLIMSIVGLFFVFKRKIFLVLSNRFKKS